MNKEKGNPVETGPSINLTSVPPSLFNQVYVHFRLSAGTLVYAHLGPTLKILVHRS